MTQSGKIKICFDLKLNKLKWLYKGRSFISYDKHDVVISNFTKSGTQIDK